MNIARRITGDRVSVPRMLLTLAFMTFIWGNSMIPAEGSGAMSMGVLGMIHEVLRSWGLPYAWVSEFLVRKTAHFAEYMILGLLASQAFDPGRKVSRVSLVATALLCAAVPSIDETIQLFVPGRSGQVTDVLLDCCGAATGIALRTICVRALPCSSARR